MLSILSHGYNHIVFLLAALYLLDGQVVKGPLREREIPESNSALPGRVTPVALNLSLLRPYGLALSFTGSELGLVGPVSLYL